MRKKTKFNLKRLNKKADIKIIESVGIMIIFFFILIIGMIFYSRLSSVSIQQKKQENLGKIALNTALLVSYMPELQCNAGDVGENTQNCVDMEKVNAFLALDDETKENYYYPLFQYATISIYQIYPSGGEEIVLYDKQILGYKTKLNTLIPVSLYEPAEKQYGFGLLSVDTYCCIQKK